MEVRQLHRFILNAIWVFRLSNAPMQLTAHSQFLNSHVLIQCTYTTYNMQCMSLLITYRYYECAIDCHYTVNCHNNICGRCVSYFVPYSPYFFGFLDPLLTSLILSQFLLYSWIHCEHFWFDPPQFLLYSVVRYISYFVPYSPYSLGFIEVIFDFPPQFRLYLVVRCVSCMPYSHYTLLWSSLIHLTFLVYSRFSFLWDIYCRKRYVWTSVWDMYVCPKRGIHILYSAWDIIFCHSLMRVFLTTAVHFLHMWFVEHDNHFNILLSWSR